MKYINLTVLSDYSLMCVDEAGGEFIHKHLKIGTNLHALH